MPQTAGMARITEGEQAMSWNDFYRRRDVMEHVLRQARRAPEGNLPFASVPGAAEVFGTEENLLLALQYKWTQVLGGYLRAEIAGPEDAGDVPSGAQRDNVDAVSRAWRAAVRDHRTLHATLEAQRPRHEALARAYQTELRTLAYTAGLAEPNEAPDEVTRIGAAFVALLRGHPVHSERTRGGPVGSLLRRLAATA